jgi:hypothetical protein
MGQSLTLLIFFLWRLVLIKRYNLAFIPTGNADQFIHYAAQLSQVAPADKYILGGASIPHVSLCHFAIDSQKIESVWEAVKELGLPKLHLIFKNRRSKIYPTHPTWGGICWISLIPDHIDKLTEIHLKVAAIIKAPLNAAFSEYDPHMTLFNSHAEKPCTQLNFQPQVDSTLEDEFMVALGLIDNVGQITKVLIK